MDRALFKHYKENPHLLEEHRKRSIIESLAAGGLTSLAANPVKPWGFLPVIAGGVAGAATVGVGLSARRRQALRAQGIDTNLIGSYAKPINDKGQRYFK